MNVNKVIEAIETFKNGLTELVDALNESDEAPAEPAKTKAGKTKPAVETEEETETETEEESEEGPSLDDVIAAVTKYNKKHGKDKTALMRKKLKLPQDITEIDESKYANIILAFKV